MFAKCKFKPNKDETKKKLLQESIHNLKTKTKFISIRSPVHT